MEEGRVPPRGSFSKKKRKKKEKKNKEKKKKRISLLW
jgi:hypothetical protein